MTRLLRVLIVAAVVVLVALPAAGPARAENPGDLYVVAPVDAGTEVDPIALDTKSVVAHLPVDAGIKRLAFTDTSTLYLSDGARKLQRLNATTLELADLPLLASAAADITHPQGTSLYLVYPEKSALGVLAAGSDTPVDGQTLTGPANLLAADRREARLVATEVGKSWIDIVNTTTNNVTKATVTGTVVAAAVSGTDHMAYVATTSPNTVIAISLEDGKTSWTAALPNEPTAVTASWVTDQPKSAIVSVGASLYAAADGKAAIWATLPDAATALTTSDEGQFVYATSSGGVVAIKVAAPTAAPASRVDMDKPPTAMAALPKTSSLAGGGGTDPGNGTSAPGAGDSGSDGTPTPKPHKTKAPATDTDDPGSQYRTPGPDLVVLLGGMLLVTVVVMVASRSAIRRWLGE